MSVSMTASQSPIHNVAGDERYFQSEYHEDHRLDLLKIGSILKQSREEQCLTLPVIAEALFIRKSMLDAIECARWDMLPHEVYVKGYVKAYAAFLKISDKLEEYLFSRPVQPPPDSAENGDPMKGRDTQKVAGKGDNKRTSTLGRLIRVSCLGAVLVLVITLLANRAMPFIDVAAVFAACRTAFISVAGNPAESTALPVKTEPEVTALVSAKETADTPQPAPLEADEEKRTAESLPAQDISTPDDDI